MQAFAPLYSALSLCNFGLSHVGHQTTKKLFFFLLSPNFVYSVIINQSRCMTAFRAQTDTKDMWRDEDGKKKDRGKEKGRKRGCHRNSKFFKLPRQSRNALGVYLECVCVGGGELRTCVYIWAFVQEPQYQTRRVTDNPTQGMHYD